MNADQIKLYKHIMVETDQIIDRMLEYREVETKRQKRQFWSILILLSAIFTVIAIALVTL